MNASEPSPPIAEAKTSGLDVWLPRIALIIVALAFLPVFGFGFVRWDDPIHLTANPLVLEPAAHSLREHLLTPHLGYPTPLTVLTYRLEYAALGLRVPAIFHATNWLLHLIVCALVFTLSLRLGLSRRAGAFAVVIFGLHPVVAEPVSWISGRKDLLALLFGVSSLLLVMPPRRSYRRDLGSVACLALGLLCKPVVAWVAILIPLFATYELSGSVTRRERVRTGVTRALPHLFVSGIAVVVAMAGQRAVGAVHLEQSLGSLARAAWYALGHHLGLLFFVHETCAKYLPAVWPTPFTPVVDLMPLVVFPILGLLLRYLDGSRRRAAGMGLALAAVSYLPSSNLLPLIRYLADSYLYGSIAGLGIFFGALVDRWLERAGTSRLVAPVFAAFAIVQTMLLVPSEMRFRDSVSLWEHTYAHNPHDYRLCQNLAVAHYDTDGPGGALAVTDACIRRFGPEHFEKNRGIALYRLGRIDESERELQRALRRRPEDAVIRHYLQQIALRRRQ